VHENTVGTITEGDTTVHGTGTATPMIKTESDVGELYSPEPSKGLLKNKVSILGGMGEDGVIPLAVELVALELDRGHLVLGHLDLEGIGVGV